MNKLHIYGWAEEPVDERPSEFLSSIGYAEMSGFHAPSRQRVAHRRRRGAGIKTMLMFTMSLVVLGAWLLYEIFLVRAV